MTFFFPPAASLSALSLAAARIASTDSFLASSTNPHVLTITASASSWSSTTSNPLANRSPSITSPSTVFLGQPRLTMDTFARFASSASPVGASLPGGSAMEARGEGNPARRLTAAAWILPPSPFFPGARGAPARAACAPRGEAADMALVPDRRG